LDIENLRTWGITGFPLVWLYLEHPTHLDVVRLLGQQQDLAALLEHTS
jgi:toxin ParE1/3/4